jgi:hypothetical protein
MGYFETISLLLSLKIIEPKPVNKYIQRIEIMPLEVRSRA